MTGGREGSGERLAARAVWPGQLTGTVPSGFRRGALRNDYSPDLARCPGAVSAPAGYEASAGGCGDATAGYGRPLAAGPGPSGAYAHRDRKVKFMLRLPAINLSNITVGPT